ncbi:uncharacterized protein Dmoj_GI25595, partial [Drosophila mojavensis]
MPLYSDSSNYYYSGGSSQLYSPYYSSSLVSSSTTSPSYTSSYNRAYPGSYMVPLLPSPRSPSYSSSSSSGIGIGSSSNSSSSILGLSSRYQPKLTTITESSGLTGRHSGHSSLMPLTRIQSPKYTSVSSYGSSNSSSNRYIPPRPIAINTADIDVSSARYRRSAEPVDRKREPDANKEQAREEPKEQQQQELQQQPEPQQQQQQPRRSTIRRNRAVVRLSTIRRRSKERVEQTTATSEKQQQEQQEHQFRDLPPPAEPSLSWRQKLAEELAAFPTISNKKSPGELLRERFYIRDEKQETLAPRHQQRQQQQQFQLQQPTQATLQTAEASSGNESELEQQTEEEEPQQEQQEKAAQITESIRRLSLVQCPTFHDICEDISSDKIDDDLNAGELRRRASIIQEQEQELLNKLQKSNSGSFQLIHLERRSSHDSTTADEGQSAAAPGGAKLPAKKKSKKLRHKITAVVAVDNAVLPAQHMPSVQELEEQPPQVSSPKPKFTANVETVEEHHQIHKIFKLPKKKLPAEQQQQSLPEGFMKASPKAKTSPLKKAAKPMEQQQQQQQHEQQQQELQQEQHVSVAQIFTFDEAAIQQNRATATPTVVATPTLTATPAKTEGVATPKPIRKALQKSESGEDFWSQIGSRETLYMTNRRKAQSERQLEATPEGAELSPKDEQATPTAATATPTTPLLRSEILFELKPAIT